MKTRYSLILCIFTFAQIYSQDEAVILTTHPNAAGKYSYQNIELNVNNSKQQKEKIIPTNLSIGVEFLRTNIDGTKKVIRIYDFPISKKKIPGVPENSNGQNEKLTLYSTDFDIKLTTYNTRKLEDFSKSELFKSCAGGAVDLTIFPLKKEKEKYHLRLQIVQRYGSNWRTFSKNIEISVGEKVRIELLQYDWEVKDIIEERVIRIQAENDYKPYIKDFLIISLEKN